MLKIFSLIQSSSKLNKFFMPIFFMGTTTFSASVFANKQATTPNIPNLNGKKNVTDSQAETAKIDESKFKCFDSKVCEYSLINNSASNVSTIIKKVMLIIDPVGEGAYFSEDSSWIKPSPNSDSAIIFYSEDLKTMQNIKSALLNTDQVESFKNYGNEIQIKFSVLELQTEDLKKIAHEFSALTYKKSLATIKPEDTASALKTNDKISEMIFSFGNLISSMLRIKLDFTKSFDMSQAEDSFITKAKNGDQFNFSENKNYRPKDNYSAQNFTVGINAYGKIYFDEKNNKIRISTISGRFSDLIHEDGELLSLNKDINFNLSNLDLTPGVPEILLVRNKNSVQLSKMNNSVIASDNSFDKKEKQILILLTATPIGNNYISKSTNIDLNQLPSEVTVSSSNNDKLNLLTQRSDLLKHTIFEGKWAGYENLYGQKVYLKIPQSVITKQNLNQRYLVKIKDMYDEKSKSIQETVVKLSDLTFGNGLELKMDPSRKSCRSETSQCQILNWNVEILPYAADILKNDSLKEKLLKKFNVQLYLTPFKELETDLTVEQMVNQIPDVEFQLIDDK